MAFEKFRRPKPPAWARAESERPRRPNRPGKPDKSGKPGKPADRAEPPSRPGRPGSRRPGGKRAPAECPRPKRREDAAPLETMPAYAPGIRARRADNARARAREDKTPAGPPAKAGTVARGAATAAPTALPSFLQPDDTSERLQNVLARRGVASRRGAAALIADGRVRVGGETVTEPGFRVTPDAAIEVDGRPLADHDEAVHTYLYHKPVGEVCSVDGQGARTVLEAFRSLHLRLVPVGRLDKESEGLLLVSNDGDLIHRLTHPKFGHRKVYDVAVDKAPDAGKLEILRSPLIIEGYRIRPVPVTDFGEGRLRFVLSEGRHRQIREMCRMAGLRVLRLKRIAFDGLLLEDQAPGTFRELTADEIAALMR